MIRLKKITNGAKRVLLMINPSAGNIRNDSDKINDITCRMKDRKIEPTVHLLSPDSNIHSFVERAIKSGIRTVIACGGDGTVSAVSKAIAGLPVTLGILPLGTQNNIALSLGIPSLLSDAIDLLVSGKYKKIDLGKLTFQGKRSYFIEVCSIGLTSAVFTSADKIQHGQFGKIPDLMATLITSAPSDITMLINGKQSISCRGHVVAVTNMPYAGRNFQIGSRDSYMDGYLDVLYMGDMSKLKLLGYAVSKRATSHIKDARIQCFRAKNIIIETNPPMPVMADGRVLGKGPVEIEVKKRALKVIAPPRVIVQPHI
ncbi:MAG: diacylglycerol/lipid kinase family protein [Eubacteriales bacterium]|jgi:diacylglycerol kinase (ATP)